MAKKNKIKTDSPSTMTSFGTGGFVPNRKVNYYREELNLLLPVYYMIRDAVEGEQAIKGMLLTATSFTAGAYNGGLPFYTTDIIVSRAIRYLPQPNPQDQSLANLVRYKSYVQRATWYNVTSRTLEGMVGQVFLRDPLVELPSELDILKKDADGAGLTLDQLANRCVRHCLAYGRGGLLVDYPATTGPLTKKDLETGNIRPTIVAYNPWDIINWRVEVIGAKKTITMLVLREVLDEEGDDGFQLNAYEQYRVLTLVNGIHNAAIYRSNDSGGFQSVGDYTPTDANGQPFTQIPFTFIGSENNDVLPNKPPLYDLVSLNIAHYRNSADYEDSCFLVGQPTPVISGVSEDWVTNVLQGSIQMGSRSSIALPVGAKAELLQAKENSMPIEAMKLKEAQMVAIGAKLVQVQRVAKTATQQIIETTAESSPLANIAKNVSAAMEWALTIAAQFVGTIATTIKYELNKDFDLTSMTADDQNAIILQWQAGAISSSEMRNALVKAGTATQDDAAWKAEVQADIAAGIIADPVPPVIGDTAKPPTDGGVPAKAPSGAGGPQPGQRRRLSKP